MNRTNATPATGGLRRSPSSLARFVCVPDLLTAPSDAVLGAVLINDGRLAVPFSSLTSTTLTSVLLYAAGTMSNDYVDADKDVRLRPERSIPSGDVLRTWARNFGPMLLSVGIIITTAAGGSTAGIVAVVLGSFTVLYDGTLRGTPLGSVVMGGCRGMSVVLGMAVVAGPPSAPMTLMLPAWVFSMPVVVALYIADVTYMAECETGASDLWAVPIGTAGVGLAVGSVAVAGAAADVSPSDTVTAAIVGGLLCWFAVWTGCDLLTVHVDPRLNTIGPAVGTCVLGLVVLDGVFSGLLTPVRGVVTTMFVVPAVGLSSAFDVS